MKISVSFLKSIYNVKETIKMISKTDADYIHVDIMDGHFVPNKNFTFSEISNLLGLAKKKLDVHLMVNNPMKYIEDYATLNVEYLTFHYEATTNPKAVIESIKNYGLKCGISINPETTVTKIKDLLPLVDQVLVMTVNPGIGGQELILDTTNKIEELTVLKKLNNYKYIISADGGINDTNIELLKEKGLEMAVSGSFICMNSNYQTQINYLR